MANFKPAKIERQDVRHFSDLLGLFIASNHLGDGLFRKAVFDAWDEASGAAEYTAGRFFKDGILYVTISSSVVRSRLLFQKDFLLERMNSLLQESDTARISGVKFELKELKLK